MSPNEKDDAFESRIAALESEIESLLAAKKNAEEKVKELRDAEDVARGIVFAQEIFAFQQEKLRLEVEVELRRKKINRLRLGFGEDMPPPPVSALQ
jgi:predicted RNase H-like nuclease (RuvC/YqgF family)